jgi:CRP-like cAMP-binding protein
MIERHLMKLRARSSISDAEERAIRDIVGEIRTHPRGKTIVRAGEEQNASTILLDGLLSRYKDLRDGQRQVTELHVAGDFADLHSFTLKRLDHNVMTLTPCRVASVPHSRLKALTETLPRLTRLYWFSTNLDAAIHREWAISLGRRDAGSRVAHLLCELQARLHIVGLADMQGYDLPLTQTDLADCLGLTSVHVNRTLKRLREDGVVDVRRGKVVIGKLDRLRAIAEFDPSYLYPEHREI